MTTLVKVKTSELTGAALDYAVAMADKSWLWAHELHPTMTLDPSFSGVEIRHGFCVLVPRNPMRQDPKIFDPHLSWAIGGLLRDKFKISIFEDVRTSQIKATLSANGELTTKQYPWRCCQTGGTALVALCRVIVAFMVGEEVEIPQELISND